MTDNDHSTPLTSGQNPTDKPETVEIAREEYLSLLWGERQSELRAEAAETALARRYTSEHEAIRRAEAAERREKRLKVEIADLRKKLAARPAIPGVPLSSVHTMLQPAFVPESATEYKEELEAFLRGLRRGLEN